MSNSYFTTPNLVPDKAGPLLRFLSVTPLISLAIRSYRNRKIERLSSETVPFWEELTQCLDKNKLPAFFRDGVPYKSPTLITSRAEEILNSNLAFRDVMNCHEKVGCGKMEEGEFYDLYGFPNNQFFERITNYLKSVSSDVVIQCDKSVMYPVKGYGVVIGSINDEMAIACIGILPSPIDAVFWSEPLDFPTIPLWDRFSD